MAIGALRDSFMRYARSNYAAIVVPNGQLLDQVLKRIELHASSYKSSHQAIASARLSALQITSFSYIELPSTPFLPPKAAIESKTQRGA